ncbi:hypothetical protein, partial [Escherichia coli]|uniref:hypothetical protein n=1 Tax=Escherichia coli TaxID=562 RepID=UPI003F8C93A3
ILTFQNHTDCPLTDFGGKTSIFSHPVYLFLRKFSLQDSRGGSTGTERDRNKSRLFSFCRRINSSTILRGAELPLSNTVPPEKTDGTQRKILQF